MSVKLKRLTLLVCRWNKLPEKTDKENSVISRKRDLVKLVVKQKGTNPPNKSRLLGFGQETNNVFKMT